VEISYGAIIKCDYELYVKVVNKPPMISTLALRSGVRSGIGVIDRLKGIVGLQMAVDSCYHRPTIIEKMTEQMAECLLAKIEAMQEKMISHHREIMAEMGAW
jgi:hypothetical protein